MCGVSCTHGSRRCGAAAKPVSAAGQRAAKAPQPVRLGVIGSPAMITRQPTASKRKGGTKIDAAHGLAAASRFTASVVTPDEPASLARFEVICGPQRWVTGGGEYARGGANRERTSGCVCSENAVVVRRRPSDRVKNGYLH